MSGLTDGPFRVLPGRDDEEALLLDVDSAEPVYLDRAALPAVEIGNRVAAEIAWDGEKPRLESATVETDTTVSFVRTDEPVFEAAQNCFETARAENEAMNSRVTYNTDSDPNGVVYTFAEQPGSRELFCEFRDGRKPLEPLIARALDGDGVEPPLSVWVLDPDEPFVLVYIVLDPDGLLEETMRDTYC